jgi:outer membrane protein TolC
MRTLAFFCCAALACAEVHTLTLRQALDRALSQNPEVVLARLDALKAGARVEQTREPFSLKLGVGSGLAFTYGFPSTIDGNAPAVFQARGQRALFNKPQQYLVEQAKESASGARLEVNLRQQEVAYRVAAAFLDAEHAARSARAAQAQYQSLARIQQLIELRVADGRELRVEATRASVNALTARNAAEEFAAIGQAAEIALAQLLGFPAGDRVRPALEDREFATLTETREEATAKALADSLEIRRLESSLKAKQLEIRSYESAHLPRINLVSQYSLLTRFNNFDVFYPRFQRNNFQIGASIEIPVFTGNGPQAGKTQAQLDIEKLEVELDRTRSRITADIDQAYRDLERADRGRALRRAALELAREDLSVLLAQADEGRASMAQVEAARAKEQEAWIAYYDAQHALELARLNLRRLTGTVLAALR